MFFTACEAVILHRLDQQAIRNRDLQMNEIQLKLTKSQNSLNAAYDEANKILVGLEEVAKMLVVYIMNRASKILTACMRQLFRSQEINMEELFSKKDNMKKTIEAFIRSVDTEFIIYHMKEPLVAEKIVFEEDFENKLLEFVE